MKKKKKKKKIFYKDTSLIMGYVLIIKMQHAKG